MAYQDREVSEPSGLFIDMVTRSFGIDPKAQWQEMSKIDHCIHCLVIVSVWRMIEGCPYKERLEYWQSVAASDEWNDDERSRISDARKSLQL